MGILSQFSQREKSHWLVICVYVCACMLNCFSYVWLCHPMDCNPLGSSFHGILQAGILEWIAISFCWGSSWPWNPSASLKSPAVAGRLFTRSVTWEAPAGHVNVVYSGNALRGYGNLVIINHNNEFLSAYAHNDMLLVKEGQNVKRGQVIAKMGSTDASRVMLHFEIRYKGNSVNPRNYLPK